MFPAESRLDGLPSAASWDDTAPASIYGRFARHATLRPDALAVAAQGASWSYADVQRRALQIAGAVMRARAPLGSCVALLLADPRETVSAMLGVFAAGRVMVPLDPGWPASRIARVVRDADTKLLITEEALRQQAERLPSPSTLVLHGRDEEAIASALADVLPDVDAASLAYVLFTSGSTGEPKGVMQNHRNVIAHIRAYSRALGISARDRLTLVSSCAVDAAVMDIWGSLLNGASLHVIDPRTSGPAGAARWLHDQSITILHATPTVFRHVVGALRGDEDLPNLRLVILGGEPARRRDFELYRERLPRGTTLVNGYGPTESTVSLQCFLDHDSVVEGEVLPLGYPVDDMDVMLLDAGELGLLSSRVALGYWRRESLTARAFLPDPQGGERRLYRTGDLGHRRADGSFAFTGRRDLQMKSRGLWIDPAAVEARLLRHPLIRDVIVLPWQDAEGQSRPGACIIVASSTPADEELRTFVAEELPEAARAMSFALFEAWPLTASGKVDLAVLRERLSSSACSASSPAPWDETEMAIATLVSEMLRVRSPGRHDSFFTLGGDSLVAGQLAARIERELGATITARAILEHQTVARLSRVVRAARSNGSSPVPRVLRIPRDLPIPASLHQRRYLARLAGSEASTAFNVAFESQLRGQLVVEALIESLRAVVRRHEALHTAFVRHEGGYLQRIDANAQVEIPVIDLSERAEIEAGLVKLRAEAVAHIFDLSRAPLIRATLVRCADERHVLIWTLHHLATDGWSRRVIEDELLTLYAAMITGAPPSLGELHFQYADYSAWLQQASRPDGAFGPQLDYWRAAMHSFEPPRLHQGGAGGSAESMGLRLGQELAEQLEHFGTEVGATPFIVYLAALTLVLSSYTRQRDVVVTTDVAGRTPLETEALVGLFTNVVPIRVDLSGDPSLGDVVARTRASVLAVLEHKDLPFAAIADALWPGRLHEYDELFPAAFFIEDRRGGSARLLSLNSRELEPVTASRDLVFVVGLSPEGAQAELTYRSHVGAERARRLLTGFEMVLESLVGDASERVSRVAQRLPF
jgi:amino acid adenylation domain-containing protein